MINEYHNAIRTYVEQEKHRAILSDGLLLYQTEEDETYDHTLVSQRVYGSRQHHDVVRVCLGLSFPHEPVPQGLFFFPDLKTVLKLRRKYLSKEL